MIERCKSIVMKRDTQKTQSTINITHIHRQSTEQFRINDPHIFRLNDMANPYTG